MTILTGRTALRNMPQGVRSRGKVEGSEASVMGGGGLFASAGGAAESSTAAGAALRSGRSPAVQWAYPSG